MEEAGEGPMELGHEPVPGYRRIFYIAIIVGVLYLAGVFLLGGH
jgi:hypothetical protein